LRAPSPQKFEQLDPVMPPIVKSLHINPGLSGTVWLQRQPRESMQLL
jgi:hypothetical protein